MSAELEARLRELCEQYWYPWGRGFVFEMITSAACIGAEIERDACREAAAGLTSGFTGRDHDIASAVLDSVDIAIRTRGAR